MSITRSSVSVLFIVSVLGFAVCENAAACEPGEIANDGGGCSPDVSSSSAAPATAVNCNDAATALLNPACQSQSTDSAADLGATASQGTCVGTWNSSTNTCTGTWTNGSGTSADNSSAGEVASAQKSVAACATARDDAESMCTTDSFSAAGSAAATLTKQASALKSMGATSGNGLAQICKNQEAMQTVVGLLSATKAAMCEVKINSCSSTCSKALANVNSDYAVVSATSADPLAAPVPTVGPTTGLTKIQLKAAMNRITTAQKNCGSYQASAVNALMQTLVSGMGAMQAAKCAKLASVTPTPIPIPTPIVTTATNCSDPVQAKINIVCICQATPSNPLCGNSQNGGLAGGAGSPGVGAGGGVVAGQGAPELPSTPNVTPLNPLGADRQAGKADPIGGGGGGAAVAGAGALPGGGGAGEAGAAKAEDKSVITGLSNGGNSSLGAPGGSSGSGGFGRGAGGAGDPSGSGAGAFSLSKYLPKFGSRDPASATGASVALQRDGVTGPNGPSIWEKVSSRYKSQESNLMSNSARVPASGAGAAGSGK